MPDIYKIATLNINGMATSPRIAILEDFLQKLVIDIVLLQEVTRPVFDDIRGFTAYTNIGTAGRGTAILTRDHIQLTIIVCLPAGRGMAADFQNVTIVNIYAPSGAERMRDRENFFSNELPYLLRGIPPLLLAGGDFNSVLTNLDAIRHPNYSRALQEFIRGFDLVNMWETSQERNNYTHYTSRRADYLAVVVRIALEATTMRRGRSYWKMNTALPCEKLFQEQ